jgi:carbon monoxide dehydrogenase subunit G
MIRIEQSIELETDRETVWGFLSDIDRVAACMPGVDSVEHLGDDRYRVRLGVQVGPIKANFGGQVEIYDLQPPERMLVRLDWKDQETASKARGEGAIELSDTSPDLVTVVVKGEIDLMGVLGKYGQGIADRKAGEIAEAFADNARLELGLAPREEAPAKDSLWARFMAWIRSIFGRNEPAA